MNLKPVLEELYPLNRSLNTADTEFALWHLSILMPSSEMEYYPAGSRAWTWTIPERWNVRAAYLLHDGVKILDFKDNPLHLVSYSLPMTGDFTFEELAPHLFHAKAIPWVFKYYDRTWGFCMADEQFWNLPKSGRYTVYIDTEFSNEPMATLTCRHGKNVKEILLMAHICHAAQANDDLSGVVTLLEVEERLRLNPLPEGSLSVCFLFAPETIGSIAHLSRYPEWEIKAGIFAEMTGTSGDLHLHNTYTDDKINYIAWESIKSMRPFGSEPCNDERILYSVGIPCISVNRFPYPEYHTSDDNPSIISEEQLQGAADAIERIVRIYASDYVPVPKWHGFPFLSGMGKYTPLANRIVLFVDGKRSVWEIAQEINEDYFAVYDEIGRLLNNDKV